MSGNNSYKQTPRRRGPGGGMAPTEKAKDFKGSISRLIQYIGRYKIAILAVMIMAAASTVFTVIGPKVLGKATTGLSEGLMKKIAGTGGIDFSYIGDRNAGCIEGKRTFSGSVSDLYYTA